MGGLWRYATWRSWEWIWRRGEAGQPKDTSQCVWLCRICVGAVVLGGRCVQAGFWGGPGELLWGYRSMPWEAPRPQCMTGAWGRGSPEWPLVGLCETERRSPVGCLPMGQEALGRNPEPGIWFKIMGAGEGE